MAARLTLRHKDESDSRDIWRQEYFLRGPQDGCLEFSVQRDNLSLVQLEGRVTNHFDLLLNIWIDDSRDGSKKRKKIWEYE